MKRKDSLWKDMEMVEGVKQRFFIALRKLGELYLNFDNACVNACFWKMRDAWKVRVHSFWKLKNHSRLTQVILKFKIRTR